MPKETTREKLSEMWDLIHQWRTALTPEDLNERADAAEHDRDINAAKNLLKQGRGTPSVEVARALPMKRRLVRDTDNRRS